MTHRFVCLTVLALTGLALASCGDTTEPALPADEGPTLATTAAVALSFGQVSAAAEHSCGLTTGNRAYCWGANYVGQLGDGTTNGSLRPVAVAGDLHFRQLSAGHSHTCGVTTDNRAYCWGSNSSGRLGDGTETDRLTPVPVAGGLFFRLVEAGSFHNCGVTTDNRAYCWGANNAGQLGNGTRTGSFTPVPVAGGFHFRQATAGWNHSCGVTTNDRPYCWGENDDGEVGDGSTVRRRLTPVQVASGRRFRLVEAGFDHTCGVTTDDRAFCWGEGRDGQIGDGKNLGRLTPRAVAGGLRFSRVTTGSFHTCGETTGNRAYCWGSDVYGGLGDGPPLNSSLTPVAVAGDLIFGQVSAGGFHACGVTSGSRAYCWGRNSNGELGDGTTTNRPRPRAVAGPI